MIIWAVSKYILNCDKKYNKLYNKIVSKLLFLYIKAVLKKQNLYYIDKELNIVLFASLNAGNLYNTVGFFPFKYKKEFKYFSNKEEFIKWLKERNFKQIKKLND